MRFLSVAGAPSRVPSPGSRRVPLVARVCRSVARAAASAEPGRPPSSAEAELLRRVVLVGSSPAALRKRRGQARGRHRHLSPPSASSMRSRAGRGGAGRGGVTLDSRGGSCTKLMETTIRASVVPPACGAPPLPQTRTCRTRETRDVRRDVDCTGKCKRRAPRAPSARDVRLGFLASSFGAACGRVVAVWAV